MNKKYFAGTSDKEIKERCIKGLKCQGKIELLMS